MAHRKKVLHDHEQRHLHEFRFSCYRRKPLLTNDDWREKLARSLDAAGFIEYLHHNPVKRGLCSKAIDWKWSSARYDLIDPPRQNMPGLPFLHGLPPGVLD